MGYPACSFERTGTELRQALRDYCSARDSIDVPAGRSTAIGTASYPIKDRLPVMAVVIVGVLIALVASIPRWKEEKHFSFRGSNFRFAQNTEILSVHAAFTAARRPRRRFLCGGAFIWSGLLKSEPFFAIVKRVDPCGETREIDRGADRAGV